MSSKTRLETRDRFSLTVALENNRVTTMSLSTCDLNRINEVGIILKTILTPF